MQRLKNFNNISDELYESIPKLEAGEIKVFHMLNGVPNPDPDIDERMMKPILYGGVQLKTNFRIKDPHLNKGKGGFVDVGLIEKFNTITERPEKFKLFVAGKGSGYFTLNGDKIEDCELYEILYLSPENVRNNTSHDAMFEEVQEADENETLANDLSVLSEALNMYNSFSFEDLAKVASVLRVDASMDSKALKTEIGKAVKADPNKFLKIATEEINGRKKTSNKKQGIKQPELQD